MPTFPLVEQRSGDDRPVRTDVPTLLVVAAWSAEPLAVEGMVTMLGPARDLEVVSVENMARVDVVLIAGHTVDERVVEWINRVHLLSRARIVLVIDELTDTQFRLAEKGSVVAVLARAAVTGDALVDTVRAASVECALPRLADQVERVRSNLLRPRGAARALLPARELEVLRLLADGCDTIEIARRMAYSERTVKTIVHVILDRFGARNRAHAVAFATREGII